MDTNSDNNLNALNLLDIADGLAAGVKIDEAVFESDEIIISEGPIGALPVGSTTIVTLADSANNIWTNVPGPLLEGSTQYIGKAWCYGEITPTALNQDGVGNLRNPSLDNDGVNGPGTPEDGGYTCVGSGLGNESQTDSLTMDVVFGALQVLNNSNYLCSDGEPNPNTNEPESIFNDSFGIGGTDTTFDEEPA